MRPHFSLLRGCCTLTRINVSASDLRQEPSAVVPHAWDLCGGCRVTGIPTAAALDSLLKDSKRK